MFSSSPIVAPLLLVLAITTLALGLHPRTRQYAVPSTWVGGSGVGGPVGVGKVDKIYDQHPAKDPTPVAAPPSQEEDDDLRLPAEYNAYFKSGRMPDALDAVPQLAARLAAFLRKPALSHAAAWEANIKNCPPSQADSLVNKDQYEGNHDFWVENVTPKEIIRRRADLVKYIAARVWEGEEVIGRPGTRGIVYTAGNQVSTNQNVDTSCGSGSGCGCGWGAPAAAVAVVRLAMPRPRIGLLV
jgi:alpha 1,2-mannosyltransferase